MNAHGANEESWKRTYREKGDLWKTSYPDRYLEFKSLKKILEIDELLDVSVKDFLRCPEK